MVPIPQPIANCFGAAMSLSQPLNAQKAAAITFAVSVSLVLRLRLSAVRMLSSFS